MVEGHDEEVAKELLKDLEDSSVFLQDAKNIANLNLLYPLNILIQGYFLQKTARIRSSICMNEVVDFMIFVIVMIWSFNWSSYQLPLEGNEFAKAIKSEKELNSHQIFMINIIWDIHQFNYRFDFVLAIIVFLTWMKLFLCFQVSRTFGPLHKILQQMWIEVAKFLTLWLVVLTMFSCVAVIAFAELESFGTIEDVICYFFEASLGAWDSDYFQG